MSDFGSNGHTSVLRYERASQPSANFLAAH